MDKTKDLMERLDVVTEAMYGGASQEPDGIDFMWWSDQALKDYWHAKGDTLDEDTFAALDFELEQRGL